MMKLVAAHPLWALLFAVAAVVPAARGVWMELPDSGQKCVSEALHNNAVIMGHYYTFYGERDDLNSTAAPSISVKITSPYGNELYNQENAAYGQFGFTTNEAGNHVVCFSLNTKENDGGRRVTVGLDWRHGIAAKDWDSVAKKEKIEGLELELAKLEGLANEIQDNLIRLMSREMEMREVSETTNARVARYSMMSLGVCIVVSLLQLLYLRRYFRKKKLI